MRATTIAIALLMGFTSEPARATVQQDQVDAAEAAAKAGAATPEGKQFEESLGKAFGREHGATVGRCMRGVKRSDLSDFDLFLRVGATGTVDQSLVRPSTSPSSCVQSKMAGWKVTTPPQAGFWVKLNVKLKPR